MKTLSVWALLAAFAASILLAGAGVASATPLLGDYSSTELGGTVNMGRWSEGDLGLLGMGNGAHSQDWDGLALGGMWQFAGATINNITPLVGTPATTDGMVVLLRTFDVSAATFTLKDTGSWWNPGDAGSQYVFNLDSYVQVLTLSLTNSQVTQATSTDVFEATWDADSNVRIINGHVVGVYQATGSQLADFPLLAPAAALQGNFGTAEGLRFTVVPEPATMGLLGLGLAGLIARRRRSRSAK